MKNLFSLFALLGFSYGQQFLSDTPAYPEVKPYSKMISDLRQKHENGDTSINEDAFKSFEFLCNKYGFLTSQYEVVTDDGYILGMYRIPGQIGESPEDQAKRTPIILQHGLGADMMEWIFNDEDKAPAYILSR